MCFISPPSTSSTLRGHEGVAVGASAVVVFRVGSVVAKVYVASRNEKLPFDVIRRGEACIHDFLLQCRCTGLLLSCPFHLEAVSSKLCIVR